ncbi:TonB-dependent receptor [Flavihumibacter petaseus]|uniref:TonB-dependent receptor n=1 Tax=Flavihumibacter petaseus NBRC 106054 TaxID=1220578 RepID=A0A0E9N3A9_9BACT|nr:TonB-dependent receptor [Flavihumibacter petaseus]GAO44283.1 hypothetical protein FPE01S_03_03210 [Flavihumibacter petaseus NBRC 106054]
MRTSRYIPVLVAGLLAVQALTAQDSTKKKAIEITSTFKPVLREAVKQQFAASLPSPDSIRPNLQYKIPEQHVTIPFLPGTLSPVALQVDSVLPWQNSQYLKVGIGNVHLPYIQGAFSLGDARNNVGIYAELYRAKGRLDFQKNNLADVQLRGNIGLGEKHELNVKVGFKGQDYFFYGFSPDTLKFTKSELKQTFQTVDGVFTLRNTAPTAYGLSYQPSVAISSFSGKNYWQKGTENNVVVRLPLQKTFGKSFGFNLGVTADITRYSPPGKQDVKNNLFLVDPALLLKTPNVFLQVGILPSWDNKIFHLLPNIMAEFITNDQRFTLQAGWIGYFNRGSYQRFAGINPWIYQPDTLMNTRVTEFYAGFKGSLANHFTYSAKVAFAKHFNENLFVNDQVDGKTFQTVYSPEITMLQLHGEIGYMLGEAFNFKAGITYTNFTRVEGQTRAWGLLPMEINGNLRWRIMKDLFLKADLYAWDGPAYRTKDGEAFKGDKAFDLNAGLEFKVLPNLDLFFQMNNVFNNRYQRWNQYEVYGFQVLGGVILRLPK